jgi:hypothetical protein
MESSSFSSLPLELYQYITEIGRIPREMSQISPETRIVSARSYYRRLCFLPISESEVRRYLLNPIFPIGYIRQRYTLGYSFPVISDYFIFKFPSPDLGELWTLGYAGTFERNVDLLTTKRVLSRRLGCIRLNPDYVNVRIRTIFTRNLEQLDPAGREAYLRFNSRILNSDRTLSPEEILLVVLSSD